jgi:hypothetical protein
MRTKKLFFTFIVLCLSLSILAQKDAEETKSIKPLRIGVKVGIPSILIANVEYVTPLLNNRIAIAVDYMSLSKTIDDTSINYDNFEIGSNIYLNKKGKGLYAGISYFSFNGEGTFTEVEFQQDVYEDGLGDIKFNTLNLKLGAKIGRTFYFRVEAGYAFGDIPEFIVVNSKTSNSTTIEEVPEIPGINTSGLPLFNFGMGFSFL